MNIITIQRIHKYSNSEATYGSISFNGILIGYTVELGWNENKRGRSCIPAGQYTLLPHNSPKHPLVVAFHNPELKVLGDGRVEEGFRDNCLIHSANFSSELEGCLAPGTDFMYNTNHLPIGVKDSKITLDRLKKLWGDRSNLEAIISYV